MIILGLILYVLDRVLEISLTSLIGTYLMVRGFSFFFGGYPDEEYLSTLFYYNELGQLKRVLMGDAYKYTIAMTIVFGISIFIQFFTFIKEDIPKDDSKNKKQK